MIKYAIDACALIDASKYYSMDKMLFKTIWDKIDELIQNGMLISSSEVEDELKDDDLINWKKTRGKMFVPLDEEIQEQVKNILSKFPTLIKMKAIGNSNADPFLIALAKRENAVIITDEGTGTSTDIKIPYVCKELNIKSITFQEFLNTIIE